MKVEFSLNCSGTWTDYTPFADIAKLIVNKGLTPEKDPIKSQTGSIEIFGDAYTFFYDNLIDSSDRYSNSICVRITNDLCDEDYYMYFKIENDNLKWCENGECKIILDMDEYNPQLDCIRRKLIANNHLGIFQSYPVTGNPHPRFRYCDIIKPTWFFGMLVTFFNSFDLFIVFIDALIITLNSGFNIINAAIGTSLPTIGTINLITDKWLGCGRGYPAPFIRTYIDNVCDSCGEVTINSESAPVLYNEDSIYYYACLLTAYQKKGVDMDGAKDYITNNMPSWTLTDLLSKIKGFWNARWFLHNDVIYFERKDLIGELIWGAGVYQFDFTTEEDKNNLIGNVCFSWNGQGKLNRINMTYATDASDNIGNENLTRFNGEWLDITNNPNYKESELRNMSEFGAPSFVMDGQDSLYDANISKAVGTVLGGTKFEGCLKTQGDTTQYAKVLIYDTNTDITDARTIGTPYAPYASLPEFEDDNAVQFPIGIVDVYNYNNPFSFSPAANGIANNLWDFHAIDVPNDSDKDNIAFEFTVQCVCTYQTTDIYQQVLFSNGWVGEIDNVLFDYGKMIVTVKGNIKN